MVTDENLIDSDIEAYLARHEHKELVRFVTVGSVDDGKSTLIGRLLHDVAGVYDDQLAAVKRATRSTGAAGDEIDFSLFTDGLKAEREQGITIDVAYRYFATDRRKFIIADTPGHVQYTRNMATGASTADIVILLLDARLGVLPQSRRHAYIASLLGIPHLFAAVNKMDLVEYGEARFEALRREFTELCAGLGFSSLRFFPISAKRGDNVVTKSVRTPWWSGGTLLDALETAEVEHGSLSRPMRLPVQMVIRPHLDYRGFAGQLASGVLAVGDELVALPSGARAKVQAIDVWEGELAEAAAPMSVTVRLDREVDVSRGDLLARPDELPRTERRFEATLVWLSERAFDPRRQLLCKHTTRVTPARVERIAWRMDLERLLRVPSDAIALNEIVAVVIQTARPIFVDSYTKNRATGAFILIDALSNDTVAAGMVGEPIDAREGARRGAVTREEREGRLGQRGVIARLAGDRAETEAVERALFDAGLATLLLDGTELTGEPLAAIARRCAAAGLVVLITSYTNELAGEGIVETAGDDAEAIVLKVTRAATG